MKNSKYITLLILLSVSVSFSNTTAGVNTKKTTTMVDYKRLFKIELRHSYFKEGKLRGVTLQPTEASAPLLQEFDMRIMLQENFLNVYLPETTSVLDLIALGITLQFNMVSQDPIFINYTELPMNEQGIVLFKNDSALGNPAQLSTTYQTTANPSQTVGRISIALANLPYTNNQEPFTYIAQFTARAVAVKYLFVAPPSITQLKMQGDDAALFSGPFPFVLENGTNAQVFDSGTNLFPLSEVPTVQRTLEFLSNAVPAASIKLPTPSPETLRIENDRIVAPVYVYL